MEAEWRWMHIIVLEKEKPAAILQTGYSHLVISPIRKNTTKVVLLRSGQVASCGIRRKTNRWKPDAGKYLSNRSVFRFFGYVPQVTTIFSPALPTSTMTAKWYHCRSGRGLA